MKKLTRKQKRALIARSIKATVVSIGIFGALLTMSSFKVMETLTIPLFWGAVRYFGGIALVLFSMYAHYKIYEED